MLLNNKYDLGFFPTPIHSLSNLSLKYPKYNLFIKRDDLTGLASGGNKTRKLEYLIQDAINNNCEIILTAGAQQSNHCRQTAAACSIAGLECHLLLGGTKPDKFDGNLLLSYLLGANIHFTGENRKGEDIESLKTALEKKGKKSYTIPYGGSNIKGALGFVNAIKELKDQLIEQKLDIDYIFFASSSGGTQAGMILGSDLFDLDIEFCPINIDKENNSEISLEENILNIINDGKIILNIKKDFQLEDITLIRDYDKDGYGVVTDKEIKAIKELATTEGVFLDPVYTGRAFYGMLDYLKKKKLKPNSNILFWHTGGLPSIFHSADKLI
ncbi:MAG: D-cysteine desulfhydrase family protein [Bacteroidota bacterium]